MSNLKYTVVKNCVKVDVSTYINRGISVDDLMYELETLDYVYDVNIDKKSIVSVYVKWDSCIQQMQIQQDIYEILVFLSYQDPNSQSVVII